jgi:hypothetical protein
MGDCWVETRGRHTPHHTLSESRTEMAVVVQFVIVRARAPYIQTPGQALYSPPIWALLLQ